MDTSQLMNHVVHRQLCYTFFTQVPIEPFFQLGLDFLFAGSDCATARQRYRQRKSFSDRLHIQGENTPYELGLSYT